MLRPIFRNLLIAISAGSIAATILTAGTAHAQALFQSLAGPNSHSFTLAAGNRPQGVAVADFNQDGFPDMVVANYVDNTIDVYLASGPGTFLAPATYKTCGGPTAVLATDLDLTGLADIVVTCNTPTSNVIEVFLNQGKGVFGENSSPNSITNIVLSTGLGPVAIVAGDFNSDGHPDLAVADSLDGEVTLFLSDANTNFTTYKITTISGLGAPAGIATGEFTNSGHLDLAVTDSSTQTVRFLAGDGAGNFTPGASPATQLDPTGIVAGDFNHDGKLDLAVVNAGSGSVSVLLGQGNGTFTTTPAVSVGSASGIGANAIVALDVNGDGYLDLVTATTLQNDVAVLMNNGDGTFQPVENYAVPNGPAYVAAGDFTRSGKPDLAVTQATGATVSILLDNTLLTPEPGSRNFLAPNTQANGQGNMADGVVAADFNNDGLPDIAASYLEDNSVRVLINNGPCASGPGGSGGPGKCPPGSNPSPSNFNTAAVYPVGAQPYWIASGDLNNDGYADLVTANTGDNTVSVLMNNGGGTGTFAASKSYPVGKQPFQVAIGDLNGDGIPDLAVSDYGDNTVFILYGQTGGTFVGGQTLSTCANPYGVAIADFRHSGQNDVAVTCFSSAQLEVFLNSGMLPFQPTSPQTTFNSTSLLYTTSVYPTSLVVGDFNRDGNLDIVTGNSIANNVSFFAGSVVNGNLTFSPAVDSFALNFPDSIAAGDINGDGILDLVTVAPNYNQVAVLLGKGDGTFQQRVEFNSGTQPWAVALADFSRDGKLDIVTANTFDRVNITSPAKQQLYMKEFPATANGNPSLNVLFNASGTNITLTVTPKGTIHDNKPVTLTATVAPTLGSTTPTGKVIFEDTNGAVLGGGPVPLSGGTASVTVPNVGSGTQQITVLYSGDVLYQPNTATGPGFVVTVTGTPVLLMAPSTVTTGTPFSSTVVVGTVGSPTSPTGTVSVYIILPNGTTALAYGPVPVVPNGNGTSSFTGTTVAGTPGTYYGYAVFTSVPPNPNLGGTSQTIQITVVK